MPYIEISIPGAPSALHLKAKGQSLHFMKTHLRYEFFKRQIEEDNMKVVIVMRNPKDVLVSFYHMYCERPVLGPFTGSFHDFFQLFKTKHLLYGDPIAWCKDWWIRKDQQENLFVVKYEDMIQDCASVVRTLAAFLHKNLDDDTVLRIGDHCSIENMKNDPIMLDMIETLNLKTTTFFRKGKVGDWKNFFTEEESAYVDNLCAEHLETIGLSFDYEWTQAFCWLHGANLQILSIKKIYVTWINKY